CVGPGHVVARSGGTGKVERVRLNLVASADRGASRTPMNTERLTTKSREVITAAASAATTRGHATVEAWHLLLALLDTGGSTAAALLRAVGANPADIRRQALHAVARLPSARASSVTEPHLSRQLLNAL